MTHQVFSRETKSFPVTTYTNRYFTPNQQSENKYYETRRGRAISAKFYDKMLPGSNLLCRTALNLQTAHNPQNELLSHPHTQQVLL